MEDKYLFSYPALEIKLTLYFLGRKLNMFDDPKIVAAVIAGIVSLLISAISGLYIILQNRKRFENIRKELIAKASAETFIKAKETYLAYSGERIH